MWSGVCGSKEDLCILPVFVLGPIVSKPFDVYFRKFPHKISVALFRTQLGLESFAPGGVKLHFSHFGTLAFAHFSRIPVLSSVEVLKPSFEIFSVPA